MQNLSNFLMVSQFILFVIVLSNMARLLSDYLITKIK
jgi:hypothetical protein